MAVFLITGKLGAGKSLAAVGRMLEYIERGAPVATNVNLYLDRVRDNQNRSIVAYRLPDAPKERDLDAIGIGNDSYDENKNGLIVLDEAGLGLNSRNWQDKNRQGLIRWLLHARKKGWDVAIIVQDISLLDNQIREALGEHVVYCRRLDRIALPFFGLLIKSITGRQPRIPRLHIGVVRYGLHADSLIADRWVYRGTHTQKFYDTKQGFDPLDESGTACLLTPWHLVGRYQQPKAPLWKQILYVLYLGYDDLVAPKRSPVRGVIQLRREIVHDKGDAYYFKP